MFELDLAEFQEVITEAIESLPDEFKSKLDNVDVVVEDHPPPLNKGRRIKIRYMTQVKARPPTFAIFASQPSAMPESYLRYLINGLRQRFGLEGVPIRMIMKAQKNPYAGNED